MIYSFADISNSIQNLVNIQNNAVILNATKVGLMDSYHHLFLIREYIQQFPPCTPQTGPWQ